MKKSKTLKKFAHTSPNKIGQGDFYGTGVRQKIGTLKRDYLNDTSSKPIDLKKPPRSLA